MPDEATKDVIIEYHAPKQVSLSRPPSDIPMKSLKPTISTTLVQQMVATSIIKTNGSDTSSLTDIPIGTMCKNGGCKQVSFIYILMKTI